MDSPSIESTIISRLMEIRGKADGQLDKETNGFIETIRNEEDWKDEIQALVSALLDLRDLASENISRMFDMRTVFFAIDGRNSHYEEMDGIIDPENFTTVAKDLDSMVDSLVYDILDDGYLRIVRAEMTCGLVGFEHSGYTVVKHFLTTNEYMDRNAVLNRILNDFSYSPFKYEVTSLKRTWFGTIPKFTRLVKVMSDRDNYDSVYNEKLAMEIDKLMCFKDDDEWADGE